LSSECLELTPFLLSAGWLSIKVGLVSTALISIPGVGLAYFLARCEFVGKSLVQTLVSLPLVLPPVAVGILLLMALGKNSSIGGLFHDLFGAELVFTWWAAAIAAAVMSFPLVVRAAESAFAEVPRRFEQVAQTLGASRLSVFFRISLPLAGRGVLYGLVLAFARGLGEFGATIMVAGNIPGKTSTLSLGIYSLYDQGRDYEAMALMGVSLVLAFMSVLAAQLWLRRRS